MKKEKAASLCYGLKGVEEDWFACPWRGDAGWWGQLCILTSKTTSLDQKTIDDTK